MPAWTRLVDRWRAWMKSLDTDVETDEWGRPMTAADH